VIDTTKNWRVLDATSVTTIDLSTDIEAFLVCDLPSTNKLVRPLEVFAYFPRVLGQPWINLDRDRIREIRNLIADAPRMLRLLKHLAEILEHNPNLDTQGMIDGENAAAIGIARLRLSEFLAEPAGGVK